MIERLYVDNYKCLVNFDLRPGALQLLFGDNGTGKSACFDVLARLRDFVTWGIRTWEAFPNNSVTAWQTRPKQTFELTVGGSEGVYDYRLVIEHNFDLGTDTIREEALQHEGKPLYRFDGENAHLYSDDYSQGPVYPTDGSRSGISSIPERSDNRKLTWFRHRLGMTYVISIDPRRMEAASIREDASPSPDLVNFASWYRHLAQDSPEVMSPLFESLREVIDGFSGLKLTSAGESARLLRIGFLHRDKESERPRDFHLTLGDISEGQRCLLALFTILHCAVREDVTLCIDEPDNFVALRELQPWLAHLQDRVLEQRSQCLVISHHPEFLDFLAARYGLKFWRSDAGPVRIEPFDLSRPSELSASELVARGWEK